MKVSRGARWTHRARRGVSVAFLFLAWTATEIAPARSATENEEKELFTIPAPLEPAFDPLLGVASWEMSVSPDANRVAVRTKRAGKKGPQVLVVDGLVGPAFDEIASVLFSPDGKRLAFAARQGKEWQMVVDGEALPSWDEVAAPMFSRDSKRFAYFGKRGGTWRLLENGREIVSGDGMRAAFGEREGEFFIAVEQSRVWTVSGPRLEPSRWESVAALVVAPDLRRLAFIGMSDEKWYVVVDGVAGPPFTAVDSLRFSADGSHFGYRGVPVRKHEYTVEADPKALARQSKLFSSLLGDDKRYLYLPVVDNVPRGAGWSVTPPAFSPDGGHFAYAIGDDVTSTLYLDGEEVSEISGDGKTAFVVRSSFFVPDHLVLGLNQLTRSKLGGDLWLRFFPFSIEAESGRARLGDPIDLPSIEWSAVSSTSTYRVVGPGARVAVIVTKATRKVHEERIDLGGRSGRTYDRIERASVRFGPDGVTYVASRGRTIYRVFQAF